MRLVRYGAIGQEKPGLIDKSGQLRDLSAQVKDLNGETYAPASLAKLAGLDAAKLPAVDGRPRIGAPVTAISKFVAIGLNYADHAKETGAQIPTEPIFFLKANTALSGPNDPIEKPRGSTKLDWEVEIAAIIGTRAKYVSEADALNHVAGYCVCNDVSERNFQIERLGQWTKGKSHDTFGPLGPWLVTKDEVPDVQKLSLWLDVNGKRRQTGSTSTMIFIMATCSSYVSQFMTLLPGDVVTLGIEGLGEQRQEIVAA
jgi:2,4-diketo-3-deoxy-L-fuconate hydrolase